MDESESESERIAKLEREVNALRTLVMKLEAKLEELDESIHPLSPRVRVVGSLRDSMSQSFEP